MILSGAGVGEQFALPTGDVWDLLEHLRDGDTVTWGEPKPHECAGAELRTSRMQLALLSGDMDAYGAICTEVGDCVNCWRAIAHWVLNLLAGDRALRAGSLEAAAGFVQSELVRMMMP